MFSKARTFRRGAFAGILLTACVAIALRVTPLPEVLESDPAVSTEFLDRNGRPLRMLLAEERRFSKKCPLDQISPELIGATLSAEDKRFRSHFGIDPVAMVRAIGGAVRGERPASGASTISQQLIKMARPGSRTLGRKLSEVWLAIRLEQVWSKDRILAEYLNRLDYGNLRIGIAAASRYYFGKPPSDLSLAEAALLAGLPKAPARLNPRTNLAGARRRQIWVLDRMRADGRLDDAGLVRAVAEPLRFRSADRAFEAPHFVDLLLSRRGVVSPDGGPIRTTLDLPLNRFAEECLERNLRRIAGKNAGSGAVVVLDNPTSEVLALAGSGDYFEAGAGQVNGAWIVRSPGSAVKPFTYVLALQNGANPCTVVPDVPTDFVTPMGLYRPNNRDNWTVGYTPEFTVAVWVGNPDGTPMRGITGVTGAAPVMHEIFEHLRKRFGTSWFQEPPGIERQVVDPLTGRRLPGERAGAVIEKCLWPPVQVRNSDYDGMSRVRLPVECAGWLAGPQNSLGNLVTLADASPGLIIREPASGTTYYLDPDLPIESQWIPLRAESAGTVRWTSASLRLETGLDGARVQLRVGRHIIGARDESTGLNASAWIEVKAW